MQLFRTAGFALLGFAGTLGTASAATYPLPLFITVPLTVTYTNLPSASKVVLTCYVSGAARNTTLGSGQVNVPVTYPAAHAGSSGAMGYPANLVSSYKGNISLRLAPLAPAATGGGGRPSSGMGGGNPGSPAVPVTGSVITCALAVTGSNVSFSTKSVQLTLP
jgi:hypothetical protein